MAEATYWQRFWSGGSHLANGLGHIVLAGVGVAPLVFWTYTPGAAALTALVFFTFREWEQYSENWNLKPFDRLRDIAEGTLAGGALGAIAHYL